MSLGFRGTIAALVAVFVGSGGSISSGQETLPCANSTLTSSRFLDLVDSLASHGDLRDIWFTEALLGIKFERDPYKYVSTRYHASPLFGLPIEITLEVYPDDYDPSSIGFNQTAYIHFREIPACLGLNDAEFATRFRGALVMPPPPVASPPTVSPGGTGPFSPGGFRPTTSYLARQFRVANGSVISVGDDYHTDVGLVFGARLTEVVLVNPKFIRPPFRWEIGPTP